MTTKMERVKSTDLQSGNKSVRSFIERSAFMKTLLKMVGVIGVSLVMSGPFPPLPREAFPIIAKSELQTGC